MGCRFEFRTQKLPYERISGNFSDFIDFGHQVRVCKKRSFLNISCNSNNYGIYINLGCRFEFRTQKLPYERILGNFFDFIDFGHQVRVCKKDHFSILAVIQKIWDLHKFGVADLNSERKNYPMKEFRAIFFDFIDFGHQVRVCKKRSHLNISCNSKIWDLHKFGLQIWIQNAKITLWKNFGQFFQFHRFWSSGPGMQKKITSQY